MKTKTLLTAAAFAMTFTLTPAYAACYADYKAKKDGPLQLHYGVMELPGNACVSRTAAANAIAGRLANAGWTLLNVLSIFDGSQLQGKKADAGQYFLRF